METLFAETLRELRTERDLSQRELAKQMYVTGSTVARWENSSRLPDSAMISRLAACLGVDASMLFSAAVESDRNAHVILVDGRKAILSGALPVLEEVMPYATIVGFTRPAEAIAYAQDNHVDLAFVDVELGKTNGLDLCHTLLSINPHMNVVFLATYDECPLDTWSSGASGFMVKPITPEGVHEQLKHLRYPW